jgi:glycosyltransferase involved in cell wall biosynthesis
MISVIIPTLEEERYIGKTLACLAKFVPEIEIIVVDGGSKDRTVEIARRYTDRVFKISERGISKAKNFGAKHSQGGILVFVDADVTVSDDFLQKMVRIFQNPSVVGATCKIMPAQPKMLEFIYFSLLNLLIHFSIGALPKTRFKLGSRGEFFAVRKKEFLKIGGFKEKIACLEDFDITFRLFELRKFAFAKDLVVYESLRRIRKLGFLYVLRLWATEFLVYLTYGVPRSQVWKVVR